MSDIIQGKERIKEVLVDYEAKLDPLKHKRDAIVADFLEVLKEKRLAELRERLNRP